MKKKAEKGGRPTKYEGQKTDKQAYLLCRLGAIDAELAEFFEVNEDTIHEWKKVYKGFSESIERGKETPDDKVERALLKRALGCSTKAVKIFCNKDGEVTKVPYRERYPPEVSACRFWLINRRRKRWRDTQEIEASVNVVPLLRISVTK